MWNQFLADFSLDVEFIFKFFKIIVFLIEFIGGY